MSDATAIRPQRTLPVWVSIFTILVSLGAGGWVVYWYFYKSSGAARTILSSREVVMTNPGGRQMLPRPQDGVIKQGENQFQVRSGNAGIRINIRNGNPVMRFLYFNYTFLVPEDQYTILMAAKNLVQNEDVAKKVNVTAAQMSKLQPLNTPVGMVVSDADRQTMAGLWKDYQSSNESSAAQSKLVSELFSLGNRSQDATKKALERRVAIVKETLSADQIELAKKLDQ